MALSCGDDEGIAFDSFIECFSSSSSCIKEDKSHATTQSVSVLELLTAGYLTGEVHTLKVKSLTTWSLQITITTETEQA
jgi:hypothetical protein